MVPRELYSCHMAVLSCHASPPPNPPRFSCAYPFLTRFPRAVLEVFWCSKWVMQHIVGKLSMSDFQRYKVCTNQSSDERVMAPGSRGAEAIFSCFSGEDSGQTGEATGEPRVARCSRSYHLSNALSVITPFLPPRFSWVSARKTRQPESSRPDRTRARHIK